jgi:hypothetical protein
LRAADRALLGNKTGATRLGFAVLLKLFQAEGRFPRRPEDVPAAAIGAIAVADCNHPRLGSQSSVGRARNHCNGPEGTDPRSLQLGA